MNLRPSLLLIAASALCSRSTAQVAPETTVPVCLTDAFQQQRLASDPLYREHHALFERAVRKHANAERGGDDLVVPVVVHIVHQNDAENISDAQVNAAMLHLDQAFANIDPYDPLTGVNTGISFCLAVRDPEGNATTGITRTVSPLTDMISETEDLAVKDLVRWDPLSYLNIWVVRSITSQAMGPGVAGYATFPGSHGQPTDGIVVEAEFFGASSDASKVTVHEAGHYLGLYHTFEGGCPNGDCTLDGDHVCDTPPDGSTSPVACGTSINTCTSDTDDPSANNPFRPVGMGGLGDQPDMITNYMDYGFQVCQSAFTQGQTDRMQNALTNARQSLGESLACLTPCSIPFATSFVVTPASPVSVGALVDFTNTSDGGTEWTWVVDGQVIANTMNASWSSIIEGPHSVVLNVEDPGEHCIGSHEEIVVVDCPGEATFQASATSILPGGTVDLVNTSSGSSGFEWYVDGSLHSTNTDESLLLATPGIYAVYLVAHTPACDNVSTTTWIQVGDCVDRSKNQWYFGYQAAIDFNSGAPVNVAGSAMSSFEGTSSIADANGDLLFYTNGVRVWNRQHQVMPNGNGLMGGWNTSTRDQALIAPFPGSSSKYYLFALDEYETPDTMELTYSVVDMAMNGGFGDVTAVKNVYLDDIDQEGMAATYHDNGNDVWLVAPERDPSTINIYLADANGVTLVNEVDLGSYEDAHGAVFSNSGKRLLVVIWGGNPLRQRLVLYDFDGATGALSAPIHLLEMGHYDVYEVAFSPDDSKLYMSRAGDLVQYDLSLTTQVAIQASRTVVGDIDDAVRPIRSGPDGKMYFSNFSNAGHLSVINAPNQAGVACGFADGAYDLGGPTSLLSLPLFIAGTRYGNTFDIAAPDTSCVASEATVSVTSPNSACSYSWFVDDVPVPPTSGDTVLIVPYTGNDTVRVRANMVCGCGAASVERIIHYREALPFSLGNDTSICAGQTLVLDAGPGYSEYLWQNASTNQSITISSPGEVWVQATDMAGCEVADTLQVSVGPQLPAVDLGPDIAACQGAVTTLDAGPGYEHYLWQDGSENQTYTAWLPGVYTVTVSGACGSSSDQLTFTAIVPELVDLGEDVMSCAWTDLLLDATNAGVTYLWNDGTAGPTLLVSTPGIYWVQLTEANGCSERDSLVVSMDDEAPVIICPPDTVLYSSLPNGQYVVLGVPIVTDDCPYTLTNDVTNEEDASGVYPVGSTAVNWIATDAGGLSSTCTTVVVVSDDTGLDDPMNGAGGIMVQQGPGRGRFTVLLLDHLKVLTIVVMNGVGQVVRTVPAAAAQRSFPLDLSAEASGVYYLRLEAPDGSFVRKLPVAE